MPFVLHNSVVSGWTLPLASGVGIVAPTAGP